MPDLESLALQYELAERDAVASNHRYDKLHRDFYHILNAGGHRTNTPLTIGDREWWCTGMGSIYFRLIAEPEFATTASTD